MPGTVSSANCPASKSSGSSRRTSKATTSWVSRRCASITPPRARGAAVSASPGFKTPTSSRQSSCATLWHVRISAALFRCRWPGASGQWLSWRPLTSVALQVPHVPVAHS